VEEGENRGLLEEKGLLVVERHRNEKVGEFFVGIVTFVCVICKVSK